LELLERVALVVVEMGAVHQAPMVLLVQQIPAVEAAGVAAPELVAQPQVAQALSS
jgi:hypothetical protein